jgi:hypothetical protein
MALRPQLEKGAQTGSTPNVPCCRLEGEGGPVWGLMVRDAPLPDDRAEHFFHWTAALLTMRTIER